MRRTGIASLLMVAALLVGSCASSADRFEQAKTRLNSVATDLFVAQYLYGAHSGPGQPAPEGLSSARDAYQHAQSDIAAFESDTSLSGPQRACARDLVDAGSYDTVTAVTLTAAFAACDSGTTDILPGGVRTLAPYAFQSSPPQVVPAGTTVLVSENGTPRLQIMVSDIAFSPAFGGGDSADAPDVPGYVFASARVSYDALWTGAEYDAYDWQLRVDGAPAGSVVEPARGPKPSLDTGLLIAGRIVSGYVVYEVPPAGRVSIVYYCYRDWTQRFEVVLRDR